MKPIIKALKIVHPHPHPHPHPPSHFITTSTITPPLPTPHFQMSSSSLLKPCPIPSQDSLLYPKDMAINFGDQYRSSNMNEFQIQRNYHENYGGIEFRTHRDEDGEKEASGVTSPPLWKTNPSPERRSWKAISPSPEREETALLQQQQQRHHRPLNYNHQKPHYHELSPTSRLQVIARGREEMMEMVKNMPDSTYELSLKDLVDHSNKVRGLNFAADQLDTEPADDSNSTTIVNEKKKNMSRSESINSNNGPFLLKMFFPTSLGRKEKKKKKKKTNSTTCPCAKVSPRPLPIHEGENDKDWWKKQKPSVASGGDTENNGSSRGSSNSSSSIRNKSDFLPGCWSFYTSFYTKKNKSKGQKGARL